MDTPTKKLWLRPLPIKDILHWASAFRAATGRFPTKDDGGMNRYETWPKVDAALRYALRGLPGGSSLAQLLAERMDYRNVQNLPPHNEEQILRWADEHHRQTGKWPTYKSGTIPDSCGETWSAINQSLMKGVRGLSGGSSLARFLALHRDVGNRKNLESLASKQTVVEVGGRDHVVIPLADSCREGWPSCV
jgi:hypothetical protein